MTQPVAFSYIRFSSSEQRKGHSLERQTEKARAWCQAHNVTLDTSRTWHDLGKSAFLGDHRNNPDRHALAAFLRLVEEGKIQRGSYLLLESLDRLTREHVRAGLMLCLGLIERGIRLVQLSPSELVYDEKADNMSLMMMVMELSRGHGESKRKSDLSGPAWRRKKQKAREGVLLSGRLPGWLRLEGGKIATAPDAAKAVRRVFDLAIGGYGIPSIVAKLTRDGVPPIGRSGRWTRSYINVILRDRRALGEYQPRKGKDCDGSPIPDYYPAVVTQDEWHAARAGARQRATSPGPVGKSQINIFAGRLFNARAGDTYAMSQRLSKSPGRATRTFAVLLNTRAEQGVSRAYSVPYLVFESAVLSLLAEIDPAEILGASAPDETLALGGELASVEAEVAAIVAEMDEKYSPALAGVLRRKEDRKDELVARLTEARQKAASPLSEAWGEAQSLLAALDGSADPRDARLRLRSALRRIVDSIWLVVVPRGHDRLYAVQVWFAGGGRSRSYLIHYRPERANAQVRQPAKWLARSLAADAVPGTLDLRDPNHAKRLAAALEKIEV